jgi:hypothetical protein
MNDRYFIVSDEWVSQSLLKVSDVGVLLWGEDREWVPALHLKTVEEVRDLWSEDEGCSIEEVSETRALEIQDQDPPVKLEVHIKGEFEGELYDIGTVSFTESDVAHMPLVLAQAFSEFSEELVIKHMVEVDLDALFSEGSEFE